jgi:hypothetical protein
MKALVLKELRELRGIAALALAAYLVLVARLTGVKAFDWVPGMPQEMEFPPFVAGQFQGFFALLTGVFAITLGFRQTAWESSQGTFLFLLHRPISRQAVFYIKLATGSLILVSCAAVPILLYGWWAATPGQIASPFRWSWTLSAWCIIGSTIPTYLGAFLSGLRPARWLGTRLLPLVAAISIWVLLALLNSTPNLAISAATFGVLLTVALFVGAIRYVALTRDYA